MAEDMIDVKYTDNTNPRDQTEVIVFSDDRPDMTIGGPPGRVTKAEFNRLVERGVGLEVLTPSEARQEAASPTEHSHGSLVHEHSMDFSTAPATELEKMADAHELDVTGTGAGGKIVKKDLEDALAAAHA